MVLFGLFVQIMTLDQAKVSSTHIIGENENVWQVPASACLRKTGSWGGALKAEQDQV